MSKITTNNFFFLRFRVGIMQPSELTTAFSFAVIKAVKGCNLRRQNFAVVEFQVSFVEFPQQETKIKVEFTIERNSLFNFY